MSPFSALGRPLRLLSYPFWAASIAIMTNDHIAEILSIKGQSMSPALSPNFLTTGAEDYILFSKFLPSLTVQRGDVIMFYAPHRPDSIVVKRVVGKEGDLIHLDKRRWKGDPENKRGGIGEGVKATAMKGLTPPMSVRVPPGHVWVEGDNWRESTDSNYYGPVAAGLILGRAWFMISPWKKFGTKPWEEKTESGTMVERGRVLVSDDDGTMEYVTE